MFQKHLPIFSFNSLKSNGLFKLQSVLNKFVYGFLEDFNSSKPFTATIVKSVYNDLSCDAARALINLNTVARDGIFNEFS